MEIGDWRLEIGMGQPSTVRYHQRRDAFMRVRCHRLKAALRHVSNSVRIAIAVSRQLSTTQCLKAARRCFYTSNRIVLS
jgi:hypothetical protein